MPSSWREALCAKRSKQYVHPPCTGGHAIQGTASSQKHSTGGPTLPCSFPCLHPPSGSAPCSSHTAGVIENEQTDGSMFQPLPFYYMEIACLLFAGSRTSFGTQFAQVRACTQRSACCGHQRAKHGMSEWRPAQPSTPRRSCLLLWHVPGRRPQACECCGIRAHWVALMLGCDLFKFAVI